MNFENERVDWMIRREAFVQRQRNLVMVLMVTTTLFLFMTILLYIIMPVKGILERYEEKLAAEVQGMKAIPSIQKEIETIQKQMGALTTESIEARLNSIEKAIKAGTINPEEVATLQALNNDFKVLKSYMFRDPRELVELKQLQKNYQELRDNQGLLIKKEDVMREISFMQNLFYAAIGLFGLLLAVMGGTWWQSTKRIKQIDRKLSAPSAKDEKSTEPNA